jgi:hypothetical protein
LEPLRFSCASGFKGDFCEIKTAVTSKRPCDYTIRILNTGAYTARFSLYYYYDDIRQPVYSSKPVVFIGNTVQHTIKGTAKNLTVDLEVNTGFAGWKTIHTDKNLGIATDCIKCYKFYGTIFAPKWDHIIC